MREIKMIINELKYLEKKFEKKEDKISKIFELARFLSEANKPAFIEYHGMNKQFDISIYASGWNLSGNGVKKFSWYEDEECEDKVNDCLNFLEGLATASAKKYREVKDAK
jgi:hypothetical protein